MGKFANEYSGDAPEYIGNQPPAIKALWSGQTGFDAMGCDVPMFRRAAGEAALKDMGVTNAERRYSIITTMANHVARDNTHAAMESAMAAGVDATGCYRLLAVLLTAEPA